MRKINLLDSRIDMEDISREIETNLIGTVRTVKQFLAHLNSKELAAIVNVSSGLAFVPLPIAPIYCAAKAGVHCGGTFLHAVSARPAQRHTNQGF